MTRRIIVVILVLALIGGGVAYYQYNREHQMLTDVEADVAINASTLVHEFSEDESKANSRYLNKSIAVTGKLIDIETTEHGATNLILEGDGISNVICEVDKRHTGRLPIKGETTTIQGICTGSLMDVILVRAVPTKQPD